MLRKGMDKCLVCYLAPMAALASTAPPLHVQHLEKALRLESFLNHVEGFLNDPSLAGIR